MPLSFLHRTMTGYDGADRQIEAYQHTIRAMGEAGIPILGYNFMPNSVWRTSRTAPGRGGVEVTAFDMAAVEASDTDGREFMPDRPDWASGLFATSDPDEVLDADTMWANYERFMHAVLPVARDAGVKLALHPDDPLHRLPARRPRAPHGRRHAVEPPCPCDAVGYMQGLLNMIGHIEAANGGPVARPCA